MSQLDNYEQQLLDGWEEAYKKGQLTLLILLSLKDGPKHMADIKEFIQDVTNGRVGVDDKSMYRALRRHHDVEMIDFRQVPGKGGPERKVYELTAIGSKVLDQFIHRNITGLYNQPAIQKLLERTN